MGIYKIYKRTLLTLFILLVPLYSQITERDEKGGFFELTPVIGFAGASPLYGLKGSMVYPAIELQLSVDLISGNFTNLYPFTLSAILPIGNFKNATPYGSVGGGMSVTIPQSTVGGKNITQGHLLFGGGLKIYINDYIGYRVEVGQVLTRINNDKTAREELLFYQQISLGLAISFGRRN